MMEYKSNRHFKLWGYTASHSFLILRSSMLYEDVDGYTESMSYNIDIEFSAVIYLDIPNTFKSIQVREVVGNIPEKFNKYFKISGLRIFEIQSEGMYYFIVAGSCRVGKNKWISEDRIRNLDLDYEEIITTS